MAAHLIPLRKTIGNVKNACQERIIIPALTGVSPAEISKLALGGCLLNVTLVQMEKFPPEASPFAMVSNVCANLEPNALILGVRRARRDSSALSYFLESPIRTAKRRFRALSETR